MRRILAQLCCLGAVLSGTVTLAAPVGAQAPPAPAARPAAPAAPSAAPVPAAAPAPLPAPVIVPEPTEPDAVAPGAKTSWRRLSLSAGGEALHASDSKEGSANRAGYVLEVGVRPVRDLEIALRYDDVFGDWQYVSSHPALDGSGPGRVQGFEHRHRLDLGVRFDVARAIARRDIPFHLSPYLGVAYFALSSAVFSSNAFGAGGGAATSFDVNRRTALDLSFLTVRGLVTGGGMDALYGPIKGLWSWSGGVSLGATEWSRLRLAYVGEALDRQSSTRFTQGALFSFQIRLL